MLDSVDAQLIPVDTPIVAGYIDGWYRWSAADWARFPNAQHVTITVTGLPGARVADCESGDLLPGEAAKWAQQEIAAGRRPTIYVDVSNWYPTIQEVRSLNLDPIFDLDWWVAGYPDVEPTNPTPPNGAVAWQYHDAGPYDVSVTNGIWPATVGPVPPPAPTNPPAAKPIAVAISTTPSGLGYWVFKSDGSVYAFGDANYFGSLGRIDPTKPAGPPNSVTLAPGTAIVDGFSVPTGLGYYLLGSDGGVFGFGSAHYFGRP
jgi:hypothetical protein